MPPELGPPVEGWAGAARPESCELRGERVRLRPLDPAADAEPLFAAAAGDPDLWVYLPDGPYESAQQLRAMLEWAAQAESHRYFSLLAPGATPQGIASYLNIVPEHGTIEIGHIWFGAPLQRTAAATEAIHLLARHAFDDLGYRRLEWKCNALNARSRRAAERFGFTYEGTFRNHQVIKGRNRDTAWYAITAAEWPAVRAGFERWLAPGNFDGAGRQLQTLEELR
jgi:RimJ/RimL family protein N-acetyltransferase